MFNTILGSEFSQIIYHTWIKSRIASLSVVVVVVFYIIIYIFILYFRGWLFETVSLLTQEVAMQLGTWSFSIVV